MERLIFRYQKQRMMVSLRCATDLWHVDDGEFRYTHLIQAGFVADAAHSVRGFQIVIGPLLFSIARRRRR